MVYLPDRRRMSVLDWLIGAKSDGGRFYSSSRTPVDPRTMNMFTSSEICERLKKFTPINLPIRGGYLSGSLSVGSRFANANPLGSPAGRVGIAAPGERAMLSDMRPNRPASPCPSAASGRQRSVALRACAGIDVIDMPLCRTTTAPIIRSALPCRPLGVMAWAVTTAGNSVHTHKRRWVPLPA
jgi:hypothetical protein